MIRQRGIRHSSASGRPSVRPAAAAGMSVRVRPVGVPARPAAAAAAYLSLRPFVRRRRRSNPTSTSGMWLAWGRSTATYIQIPIPIKGHHESIKAKT